MENGLWELFKLEVDKLPVGAVEALKSDLTDCLQTEDRELRLVQTAAFLKKVKSKSDVTLRSHRQDQTANQERKAMTGRFPR